MNAWYLWNLIGLVLINALYFKDLKNVPIFLVLYVDDMVIILSPSLGNIDAIQHYLFKKFEWKALLMLNIYLAWIFWDREIEHRILLNQTDSVLEVLKKLNMPNARPVSILLAAHFMLSNDKFPKTIYDMDDMKKVPYSNYVGF